MKLLVISLAGIGDTLISTPLIRELRLNFPDAQIDALTRWAGAKDFLQGNPNLNTVHQKNFETAGKLESLKFLLNLRGQDYDVSINTHPQSRTVYRTIARIIGARTRISHSYECSGPLDPLLINRTLPQDYARHSIEQNFDVLPLLGGVKKLAAHGMEVFLSDDLLAQADSFLASQNLSGRRLLGVHVGSGSTKNLKLKRWPLEHYLALFKKLRVARPDLTVLLFGGPDEESDFQKILAESGPPFVVRTHTKNFRQAAALLKRCAGFLSVDTVLMHLAAAPTLNATNLPYGNKFSLVANPAIAGRHLEFYRYDGAGIKGTREELLRCMAAVTVDDVMAAIQSRLPA